MMPTGCVDKEITDDHPIEQIRLVLPELFVYKVPPLKSASGHRAEEWNLDNPIFTGLMKIFQMDTSLRIVIFRYKNNLSLSKDPDNLIEFAACPIQVKPKEDIIHFVDSVIDSSRYFVIRVKDPNSSRSTNLGIGFRERETAFDFKSCLNEYVRYVDRMALADMKFSSNLHSEQDVSNEITSAPSEIYTLKPGEKIKLNLKSSNSTTLTNPSTKGASDKSLTIAKPPAPGSILINKKQSVDVDSPVKDEDEEWDEFQ